MKKNELKIINITPQSLHCIAAACPTIFKTNKETYIIIGKKLSEDELSQDVKNKVSFDEIAVEIPQSLLAELNK